MKKLKGYGSIVTGDFPKRDFSDPLNIEIDGSTFITGVKKGEKPRAPSGSLLVEITSKIHENEVNSLRSHSQISEVKPADPCDRKLFYKGAKLVIQISKYISFGECVRKAIDVIAGALNGDYKISEE